MEVPSSSVSMPSFRKPEFLGDLNQVAKEAIHGFRKKFYTVTTLALLSLAVANGLNAQSNSTPLHEGETIENTISSLQGLPDGVQKQLEGAQLVETIKVFNNDAFVIRKDSSLLILAVGSNSPNMNMARSSAKEIALYAIASKTPEGLANSMFVFGRDEVMMKDTNGYFKSYRFFDISRAKTNGEPTENLFNK